METSCPSCGHEFDSQVAPGLKGACPRCLAEFVIGEGESVSLSPGVGEGTPAAKFPLRPGDTFRGLEVVEVIGQGGMGVVYKARQVDLDRIVAIKVLSPRLSSDPEFARRFNREAKTLARLNHPGVVQIFEFGREEELYFLVMEFVQGISLREMMREKRAPEEALRIVPQLCEALEYAHGEGVVHRDIKPENILIDVQGHVKITDFGLAKLFGEAADAGAQTDTNVAMGTPRYMAPEQHEDMKRVDHRADIYSLGAVFYEMLTGEVPVGRFEPPSQLVQVDVRLDEVVLKALDRRPERRYQRAVHMKTDVDTIISSRTRGAVGGEGRDGDPMMVDYCEFQEAQRILGMSEGELRAMVAAGKIPASRDPARRRMLFSREKLAQWRMRKAQPYRVSRAAVLGLVLYGMSVVLAFGSLVVRQYDYAWLARDMLALAAVPFTGGMILAIVALIQIRESDESLIGRTLAWTTIVFGVLTFLFICSIIAYKYQKGERESNLLGPIDRCEVACDAPSGTWRRSVS